MQNIKFILVHVYIAFSLEFVEYYGVLLTN